MDSNRTQFINFKMKLTKNYMSRGQAISISMDALAAAADILIAASLVVLLRRSRGTGLRR
jgi:hypothetical protein